MFGPSAPTLSKERLDRYERDRAVLAEIYPGVRHYVWADGRGAIAEGNVDVDVGAGCWETVEISMIFERNYPRVPPRVFDRAGRWKPENDRHILDNHEFCLWLAHADTPSVATSEALREFLLRLLLFLRDQFVFDDLHRWPGKDWRHGKRAAYAQHLLEVLEVSDRASFMQLWPLVLGEAHPPQRACRCGSQLPYFRCHRTVVERVRWLSQHKIRDRLPGAVEEQLREAS